MQDIIPLAFLVYCTERYDFNAPAAWHRGRGDELMDNLMIVAPLPGLGPKCADRGAPFGSLAPKPRNGGLIVLPSNSIADRTERDRHCSSSKPQYASQKVPSRR